MPNRPMIMLVDDNPHALTSLLDALVRRYGGDYRVVSHLSGREALEDLTQLVKAGERVALIIADQWMPELTGVEVLRRAHAIVPDAQRALLVGWGDHRASEVILQGCAFGQLDNYLLKPWSPPEVHLYPVIGEFLADWTREHEPRMELIRLLCSEVSPRGHELRELLERAGLPYGFYVVESELGRKLLAEVGLETEQLPAVIIHGGTVLLDPSNLELARALGFAEPTERACDLAIVGAGPAGLAAAVSGGSEGLHTLVIEREVTGGQAGTSSLIRNYLGFPRGISGADLAQRAFQQGWLFGARYLLANEVIGLRADGDARTLVLSGDREVTARAVLIASGAAYRRLGVPSLERFTGAGLFYSAGPDIGLVMRGHDVVVIGGGNSAGQAVVHAARSARHVLHVVRGANLAGMSDYLVREIERLPNVETRFDTEVVGGAGGRSLERILLRDRARGREEELAARTVFALIGASPHTEWLEGVVARDHHGFVLTGQDLPDEARAGGRRPLPYETSVPGVFAAGDVRVGSTKRLASAVGEGAAAIHSIHTYLADHPAVYLHPQP